MTAKVKKRLFDLLRIGVCIAALWLVLRGVTLHDHITRFGEVAPTLRGRILDDGDPVRIVLRSGEIEEVPVELIARDADGALKISYGLRSALARCRTSLLLLAVLIHLPVVFFQGLRIRWLLRAQSIEVSFWEGTKLSWAGNFLNFATPLGSNAGDVFKAYFVSLHTPHKTEAVTTVVLDRVIGLGTLLLVVAGIITLSPGDGRLAELRPFILTPVGIGLGGVLLYLAPPVRRLIPRSWLERLPMHDQVRRMDCAARTLAGHIPIVAGSILLTVILQALAMGAYFTVAVALGMNAHLGNVLEYYAYFYTGAVVQALPGPPQGLGTVELAYRYFFSPYGTPAQIVCVAFVVRLVVLACALPGLLVTLTGSYKPRAAATWHAAMDQAEVPLEPVRN